MRVPGVRKENSENDGMAKASLAGRNREPRCQHGNDLPRSTGQGGLGIEQRLKNRGAIWNDAGSSVPSERLTEAPCGVFTAGDSLDYGSCPGFVGMGIIGDDGQQIGFNGAAAHRPEDRGSYAGAVSPNM